MEESLNFFHTRLPRHLDRRQTERGRNEWCKDGPDSQTRSAPERRGDGAARHPYLFRSPG